jgi:hypothetical protein
LFRYVNRKIKANTDKKEWGSTPRKAEKAIAMILHRSSGSSESSSSGSYRADAPLTLTILLKVFGLPVVPLGKQKCNNEYGSESMGFDPQKGSKSNSEGLFLFRQLSCTCNTR